MGVVFRVHHRTQEAKTSSSESGPRLWDFAVIAVKFIEQQLIARRHPLPFFASFSLRRLAPLSGDFALEKRLT